MTFSEIHKQLLQQLTKTYRLFGNTLPGGSQVFGGFRPDNAVSKNRQSVAGYVDFALNITDWFLADAAARYENYSDFGSTFNYKLASRIKVADNFNLRFAGSTGFRAPSIHQIYYNVTFYFVHQRTTFGSRNIQQRFKIANLLGIPKLKQETSKSASVGFTYKIPSANLTITADGYFTKIDDRILLTGQFSRAAVSAVAKAAYDEAQVNATQFFCKCN